MKLKKEIKEKELLLKECDILKERDSMGFEAKFKEIEKENRGLKRELKFFEEEIRFFIIIFRKNSDYFKGNTNQTVLWKMSEKTRNIS